MWLTGTLLVPSRLLRAHVADCVNKGIVKPANQSASQVTWKGAHWLQGADVTMAGMNVAPSLLVSGAVDSLLSPPVEGQPRCQRYPTPLPPVLAS